MGGFTCWLSTVENTPWGPSQAVRSIPGGHRMEDGRAATQLIPAPSYDVAMEPQSSGDPVSCAPRQRALGSNRGAARPPRAPPGRSGSQLEPPGSWGRHWGANAAAEQLAVEPILAASEPPSVSSVLGQRCVLRPEMGMCALLGHVATHRYAMMGLCMCCVVAGLP
jgi:hypothetical protein